MSIKNFLDQNPILKTGLLLGLFGTILVSVLALLNEVTAPQIAIAQEAVEKRKRQEVFEGVKFNNTKIHILEKNNKNAFEVFNGVVNLPDFNEIKDNDTLEFTVTNEPDKLPIKDRLGLKSDPIIVKPEQFRVLKGKFKNARISYVSYNEAYVEENGKNVLKGWVIKYSAPGGYGGNIGMLIGFDTEGKVTGYQMVEHNETPGLGVKANEADFISAFIGKKASDMPKGKPDFKEKLGIDVISGATITSVAISGGVKKAYELLQVGKNVKKTTQKMDKDNKEGKEVDPKEKEMQAKMDAEHKKQEALAKEAELKRLEKQKMAIENQKNQVTEKKSKPVVNKKQVIIKRKKGDLPMPSKESLPKPKLRPEEQGELNKLFKNE